MNIFSICCCKKQYELQKTKLNEVTEDDLIQSTTNINQDIEKSSNLTDEFSISKKEKKIYEITFEKYLNPSIDNTELFNKNWYREGEYEIMEYSKRSIIALHDYIFDDETKLFREFYNKENLILSINESGSIFSKNAVIRMYYKLDKNQLPKNTSIQDLLEYLTYTNKRMYWDDQLKIYKVIEGNETEKCIIQNWMKSPIFFMSERDILEKKVDFYENGILYTFESSVNDNYIEIPKDVVRITDFIFLTSITENDNEFIIRTINQVDYKMNSPNSLLCTTMSGKIPTWYKKFVETINKDFDEGKFIPGKKIIVDNSNKNENKVNNNIGGLNNDKNNNLIDEYDKNNIDSKNEKLIDEEDKKN